ncbi:hypothetical protein ACM9XA_11450 [Xanthomonas sacchari]
MFRPTAEALHKAFYEYVGRMMFDPHGAVRACILAIEDRAKAIDATRARENLPEAPPYSGERPPVVIEDYPGLPGRAQPVTDATTLRDDIAMRVLAANMAQYWDGRLMSKEEAARLAYEIADSMLAVRGGNHGR